MNYPTSEQDQPQTTQPNMIGAEDVATAISDFKLSFVEIKNDDGSILYVVANKTLYENSTIRRKVRNCLILSNTGIFTVYQKRGKCDWLERIFGNNWFFVGYHLVVAWLILYGIDAVTLNFFKY